MELNEIPLNHRLYSRSLIKNKVIPFAHNLLGELNPNLEERFDIDYTGVAFLIDKVYIIQSEDGSEVTVWFDASVLDTPSGRLLNKLLKKIFILNFR